ncbi:hypothetical protein EDD86DRAFT_278015 [Gorgonomyces haynaldii]|nr:hypothetical protein EDD86DRAFT_278015 [Gorgonomyces haynaldii]
MPLILNSLLLGTEILVAIGTLFMLAWIGLGWLTGRLSKIMQVILLLSLYSQTVYGLFYWTTLSPSLLHHLATGSCSLVISLGICAEIEFLMALSPHPRYKYLQLLVLVLYILADGFPRFMTILDEFLHDQKLLIFHTWSFYLPYLIYIFGIVYELWQCCFVWFYFLPKQEQLRSIYKSIRQCSLMLFLLDLVCFVISIPHLLCKSQECELGVQLGNLASILILVHIFVIGFVYRCVKIVQKN